MVIQVFHGLFLDLKRLDVIGLHLVDHLEDVAGVPVHDWQDGTVTRWAVWSSKHLWLLAYGRLNRIHHVEAY